MMSTEAKRCAEFAEDYGTPTYRRLKALIVNHDLGAGTRIRLEPLADQLSVSNTPVREALFCLAAERLAEMEPNVGFFTKQVSEAEFRDLYRLMQLIVEWSLGPSCPERSMQPHLDPPSFFNTTNGFVDNNPKLIVEMADELFLRIVMISGNTEAAHIAQNILDRTYFALFRECQLNSKAVSDLHELCRLYYTQDITNLRSAIRSFFEERLRLLPDLMQLL